MSVLIVERGLTSSVVAQASTVPSVSALPKPRASDRVPVVITLKNSNGLERPFPNVTPSLTAFPTVISTPVATNTPVVMSTRTATNTRTIPTRTATRTHKPKPTHKPTHPKKPRP